SRAELSHSAQPKQPRLLWPAALRYSANRSRRYAVFLGLTLLGRARGDSGQDFFALLRFQVVAAGLCSRINGRLFRKILAMCIAATRESPAKNLFFPRSCVASNHIAIVCERDDKVPR